MKGTKRTKGTKGTKGEKSERRTPYAGRTLEAAREMVDILVIDPARASMPT